MNRAGGKATALLLVLACAPPACGARAAHAPGRGVADPLDGLRLAGCEAADGGHWRSDARLERAARAWARGGGLEAEVDAAGFPAMAASGLHFRGVRAGVPLPSSAASCRVLGDRSYTDLGLYRRGDEAWVVLARAVHAPEASQWPVLRAEALRRVNEARSRARRCGRRAFAAAPPLRPEPVLDGIAAGHARDMATRQFFDHLDPEGHTPGDRVRAAGYAAQRVGENIAYGPQDVAEAVQGWLRSPGHCENVMDPHFTLMGLGVAAGHGARPGLYWVQLVARPAVAAAPAPPSPESAR